MIERSPLRHRLIGLALSILGTVAVFGTVLVINRAAINQRPPETLRESVVSFERRERPPEPQTVRPPEPPRRPPRPAPAAPPALLGVGLSGIDFGLPAFSAEDLGALGGNLLGEASDVVMTDDTVDVPPRPVRQTPMQYPPRARAMGVRGYVVLSLLISPTGEVEQVRVLESEPPGVFDDTASQGVMGWRFEPASYRGENVRVWARQRVRFDLS